MNAINKELLGALKQLLEHHGYVGCNPPDTPLGYYGEDCIKHVERAKAAIAKAEEPREPETKAEGLMAIAEFLMEHPEFEEHLPSPGFDIVATATGEFQRLAPLFGAAEKKADDHYFILRKKFGPARLDLFSYREKVCKRVKVGTKIVPARIVPASVEPERVEDVYEWECPESILAPQE